MGTELSGDWYVCRCASSGRSRDSMAAASLGKSRVISGPGSLDDAELPADAGERLQGAIELLVRQSGRDDRAQPSLVQGNRREDHRGGEDAFLEQAAREPDRRLRLADDDRRDRRFRAAGIEAE